MNAGKIRRKNKIMHTPVNGVRTLSRCFSGRRGSVIAQGITFSVSHPNGKLSSHHAKALDYTANLSHTHAISAKRPFSCAYGEAILICRQQQFQDFP